MTGARRFRPSLTATLMTVPAVALMLGLGSWQIQRMGWKADLLERVERRTTAAPVPLPPRSTTPPGGSSGPSS